MKLPAFIRSLVLIVVIALSSATTVWGQRTVTAVVSGNQIIGTGFVSIVLASQGNENALGFSVTFDPAVLRFDTATAGTDLGGSAPIVNALEATSGRVGILVSVAFGTSFATGNRELVKLNFTVLAASTAGIAIGFGDSPAGREISDPNGIALPVTYNGATITTSLLPTAPTITTQPQGQTVVAGGSVMFTVAATGNPTPTIKWQKSTNGGTSWTDLANSGRISGAATAMLTLTGAIGDDVASYRAVAHNTAGADANSDAVTLALTAGIANYTPTAVATATTVTINGAGFTGATAVRFNGVNAASFTIVSQYQITAVVPALATAGQITVTTSTGATLTASPAYTLTDVALTPRLVNTSIRTSALGAEAATLSNFTIEGSVALEVIVRAVGPGLSAFGLTGVLADPFLSIYDGSGTQVASNNDWDSALASKFSGVGAFNLTAGSKDAALAVSLQPGTYTARVTGVGGTTGQVLLEVYESASQVSGSKRIPYLATRAQISTGGTNVSGFVIGGAGTTGSKTLLIRAVGAGLGVAGALSNPTLTVFSGASSIATNDNFGTNANIADINAATAAVGAMPLNTNDSAVLLTVAAGAYTVQVSGVGGTSGIVLTEVFIVDSFRPATIPPALLAPLLDQAPSLNGNVSFAAPFVGKPNPTFQWQKDSANINGQTNSTLTLSNVTAADSAAYRVVLTADANVVTSAAANVGVAKAAQTITFPSIPAATFGQTAITLGVTATSGLAVSYVSSNTTVATIIAPDQLNIVGVGTSTITASQAGNPNFLAAPDMTQNVTVGKGTATVTIASDSLSATYDGTAKPVTATTTPTGLTVNITYAPVAGGAAVTTAPTNVGSYNVVATVQDANYQGTASGTLVIEKAAQTITFAGTELSGKTFGDLEFTLTATNSSPLPITFTSSDPLVANITSNSVKINTGGTTTITATQAGDSNYLAATSVARTLTVAKAAGTVALTNLTHVYNGSPKAAGATTGPITLNVVFTYTGTSAPDVAPTNSGSYGVTATISDTRYAGTVSGTLTIAKAPQSITFAAIPGKALDDNPFSVTATASSGLPVSYASSTTSVATINAATGAVTLVGTGSTTITASIGESANFLAAADQSQTLTVSNASQTIDFAALAARTYAANDTFTVSATAKGKTGNNTGLAVSFASSNPAVATVGTTTLTGGVSSATVSVLTAGTIDITASQAGSTNFAPAINVVRPLLINKAAATVALGNLTATYDGTPKAASATTTPASLNVVFAYGTAPGTATPPTNAGTYAVTATITENNYTGSATGNLVIAKANQTITFGTLPIKLITDAPFTLGATAGPNLAVAYTSSNSAVATVSGNTVTVRGLGTTTITATQAGDANFNAATPATQSLVVNPIAPVITSPLSARGVNGRSFFYAIQTNPTPATFTSGTLPAGLTLNASTGIISGTPTVTATSNVTITAQNATGSDPRTLAITIQDPPPVITSPAAASGQVGVAFTYTATAAPATGVIFSALNLPTGLTIASTGLISGTPTAADTFTVTLTATNATGSISQPVVITIIPAASAPVYTGPLDLSGTAGVAFTFTPNFGTGTGTTYAQTGTLPTGLTFTAATGVISGTTTQVGTFPITITATRNSLSTVVDLSLSINPALTAPMITNASPRAATVNSAFTYTLAANPATGVTFAATGLPAGLTLASATGIISGTPTVAGTANVQVNATNAAGTGPNAILVIAVSPSASAPVITSAPVVTGQVGVAFAATAPYTYQLAASNSPTLFEITAGTLPAGLVLDAATGAITGTPTAVGDTTVWFAATAGTDRGFSLGVLFSIAPAPNTPVITSNGTANGQVGQPFTYGIVATNSPNSYAATGLPAGLALNTTTGVISGIPNAATTPTVTVTLIASNAVGSVGGASNPKSLLLTIASAPATPIITSPLTAAGTVGTAFTYQVAASQSPTSYVAADLPAGLTINPASGAIAGTPTVSGSYAVILRAANAGGIGAPSILALTLAPALSAPAISSAATAPGRVGTAFTYQIVASNGPIVSYSVTDTLPNTIFGTLPLGLALNTATGALTGTPAASGRFSVQLFASNAGGTSLPQSLLLDIAPAVGVPAITSPNVVVGSVGVAFTYTITATNMTGSTPFAPPQTLDCVNLPPGLAVNPATGVIQGVPTAAGTTTASLVGTNATGTGPVRDLTIVVLPALTAPVVTSSSSVAAQVGAAFSYQIVATNTPTAFEVIGAPAWMSVNNTSGLVAGTPTEPGSLVVLLLASNSAGSSGPQILVVNIAAAAGTPLITSSHTGAGSVGVAFTYTLVSSPAATTYVATGLPAGLALNPSTGVISGAPAASGIFNVIITPSNASGIGAPAVLVLTIQSSAQLVVPGS